MICASCGGQVEWRGPLSNLTHTECLECGAVNNQQMYHMDEDEQRVMDRSLLQSLDFVDDSEKED